MAQLGSLFDEDGEGPRGPDLRVTVEVPLGALGASFRAPVPRSLAADGELVERVVSDDDPDTIELHLPEDIGPRSALVLRGQGGVCPEPDGRPGNLVLMLELVDRPPRGAERITSAAPELAAGRAPAGATVDMTWWILLAFALIGGGIVAAFALQ